MKTSLKTYKFKWKINAIVDNPLLGLKLKRSQTLLKDTHFISFVQLAPESYMDFSFVQNM